MIARTFESVSGCHIGPTRIRQSYVTHMMDGGFPADDNMKSQIAEAMRHSTKMVGPSEKLCNSTLVMLYLFPASSNKTFTTSEQEESAYKQ